MMDTKAAFESWWKDEYSHLESSKYTDLVPHIKYGFFQAWTASRAAIEIEFPELAVDHDERLMVETSVEGAFNLGVIRSYQAIKEHGIRIKRVTK